MPGICPDKSLEAALGRIDNFVFYENIQDIFHIAALYAFVIAQGHIFNDANKRTGLMSMYNFLEINNLELDMPENKAADLYEPTINIVVCSLVFADRFNLSTTAKHVSRTRFVYYPYHYYALGSLFCA